MTAQVMYVSQATTSTRAAAPTWLVPADARPAWDALRAALDELGPVPCEVSFDRDAWWADNSLDGAESQQYAASECRACPVAAECLAYALAADERFGVWGGRTPRERAEAAA